ncbi:MAG: PASTA domain-containing protein [Chitinophagaceae bacterium]
MLLLAAGLLYLFFTSLNKITNHGLETKVPNMVGKNLKVVMQELKDLGFQVNVDSTYKSYRDPLEVLFQEPEVGSIVKVGRTIFLTVNKKAIPSISMPNLVNLSFRNALLTMQSYRLAMGDTIYKPDVAAGAVLEMLINGHHLNPGTPIPYGSKIDLVVGEGLTEERDVPNLIGLSWAEAKSLLETQGLTYNILWDGMIEDTMGAIIYQQTPEAINELDFKNTILIGDMMDLRIMQSPSADLIQKNMPGSKKLLGYDSSSVEEEVINEQPVAVIAPTIENTDKTKPKADLNRKQKINQANTKTSSPIVNEKPIGSIPKKDKPKEAPKKDKSAPPPVKQNTDHISNEFE